MKHMPVLILAMTLAFGLVTFGCRETHVSDARLTAADSLMHGCPDSALAMLEAMSPADLPDEADRAYHGLLVTQARYKCYITATSDSDINRALTYYRKHKGEREKLTRAYIYKGAVMEELGQPDSAMLYYMQGEATAREKDYVNKGQANIRIGSLYRKHYADFQACYEKYSNALKYYRMAGDKAMQQNCYYNMGMCASITGSDNPIGLLEQAFALAVEMNDSSRQFDCMELWCRQLARDSSKLKEAKQLGLNSFNNYKRYLNNHLLLDLAYVYALEGNCDSARYFLCYVNEGNSSPSTADQIRIRKYEVLAAIAKNEGNLSLYGNYCERSNSLSDKILNNKAKYEIKRIESQHESKLSFRRLKQIDHLRIWLAGLVAGFVLLLIGMTWYFINKLHRIKAIVKVINDKGPSLEKKHQELMSAIHDKDNVITQFTASMVDLMQTAIKATTTKRKLSLDKKIRHIVANAASDNFWKELRLYLDNNYDGIITRIAQNPSLSEQDLKFIELMCCDFSFVEIAITMDYSPKYISTKRRIIAEKLGLKEPIQLRDYLKNEMNR